MVLPEFFHASAHVQGGILPLIYSMIPHRVAHHGKKFVVFDQRVYKQFKILIVHIVVTSSMNNHEVTLQFIGMSQGRAFVVAREIIVG